MMANINLSNLNEAIGLINSSPRPRKSKSNVVQHAQQTEHEKDHRVRVMTAWELSYINTPPGWILARDDSERVEFYPLETQTMNEDNKVREQDILDDIISYAEMHPVDDFGGLVNILGSFPNRVSLGELKTEQLRRWLRKEKMVGLGGNKAEHPPPGLKILGYSSQNELLVRDSSGRSRYVSGQDLCEILSTTHCQPSGDLATIRLALGTQGQIALARGNILIAEGKYLQLLRSVKTFKGDPQVEFLGYMHLAMNIYKANQMIKQAAGMFIQALNLSQRLYGMDNINNFTIMGNLARHYDKLNRREEAAALLRRSLRGRLNCGEQEAALLDKQDLAKIYVDLGDNSRAVQLFEEAYEGFQQVLGPEHRTTLLAINNFAGVACSAGSLERGRSLLLSVIPLLQKSLGPDDDVSWSSICNFLNYAENGRIPDTIVPVIQVYLMQSSPASLKVLKCLAEFYGRNGLVRKAMEAYKRLSERIKMLNSTSDRGVLDALYGEAYALEKLGEYNEAVKQYRQLRSIATNYYPAELQRWNGICDLALKDLSQRQEIVSCERSDWGSNIPAKCSVRDCNNQCLQFCSGEFHMSTLSLCEVRYSSDLGH
jgi:tetratricopeptide (TPR) repeat protein